MNLIFSLNSKDIENGRLKKSNAHEFNTWLSRLKCVCNKDDLEYLDSIIDVIKLCNKESRNRNWIFYKLTKFRFIWWIILRLQKRCFAWNTNEELHLTCSSFQLKQNNQMTTTFTFFMLFFSTCTEIEGWKRKRIVSNLSKKPSKNIVSFIIKEERLSPKNFLSSPSVQDRCDSRCANTRYFAISDRFFRWELFR